MTAIGQILLFLQPMSSKPSNTPQPVIHVAIPAMNEAEYLPHTLSCLQQQSFKRFRIWICVNQPENYWGNLEKEPICHNNAHTIANLHQLGLDNLHILDHSSAGKGWGPKKHGVGTARKTLMDAIAKVAHDDDILLSLDADTRFGLHYLQSVAHIFQQNPGIVALANPYYHPLVADEALNRAMLRYEIYMRYYALNMWRIGSIFSFTPLGSAMATTIKAYKKIGGLTPKMSGEDFYFLQKLRKAGRILTYNHEWVYPGNRLSDRVFFGTGPALIKGIQGLWEQYPLYSFHAFDLVRDTISLFPRLFREKIPTPMDPFLASQFREEDVFEPLRENNKIQERFVKACHEKIDGLRILQFLKQNHRNHSDEQMLIDYLDCYHPEWTLSLGSMEKPLNFLQSPIEVLDKIRNFLMNCELEIQKDDAQSPRTPF